MLKTLLSPLTDKVYAAIRIVLGATFAFYGAQKLFGLLWVVPFPRPTFPSQAWWGGLIEFATGLLIAAGLFTRCAAFLASGTMAVAYWQFHVFGNHDFQDFKRFIPGMNGGAPAMLYCFWFLYMACKGAGPWSVDAKREKAAAN